MNFNDKFVQLKKMLSDFESVIIAYSGGTDSAFLAKVAVDTLGSKALAVTGASETYTPSELAKAKDLAKLIGINHHVIKTDELVNQLFYSNPPERCYYCKKELLTKLIELSQKNGYKYVLEGSNKDDTKDFRPGLKAVQELGVRSPLKEVGFTKSEIRELSKELGLPTWNKPAMPCLSSRIPYGFEITKEKLNRIAKAEQLLTSLEFSPVRVRDYEHTARIEIEPEQFQKLLSLYETVVKDFQQLGYTYVTLDLAGFRSGSMNDVIKRSTING